MPSAKPALLLLPSLQLLEAELYWSLCFVFLGDCGGVSLLVRIFQGGISFSGDSAASPCCYHCLLCSPRSCTLGQGKGQRLWAWSRQGGLGVQPSLLYEGGSAQPLLS